MYPLPSAQVAARKVDAVDHRWTGLTERPLQLSARDELSVHSISTLSYGRIVQDITISRSRLSQYDTTIPSSSTFRLSNTYHRLQNTLSWPKDALTTSVFQPPYSERCNLKAISNPCPPGWPDKHRHCMSKAAPSMNAMIGRQ